MNNDLLNMFVVYATVVMLVFTLIWNTSNFLNLFLKAVLGIGAVIGVVLIVQQYFPASLG